MLTLFRPFRSICISGIALIRPATFATKAYNINLKSAMLEKKPFNRLSKDIVPVNYAIRLKPDLTSFVFEGLEEISLEVKNSTNIIALNCSDIKVNGVSYHGVGHSFVNESISTAYSEENELVTFTFPENLQVGQGKLSLSFVGQLNDKMKGFYRSKYTTAEGEERYCAVTQFEATDARRAFPCWDEPAIKATFDVTLVVPKDRTALSNMPTVSSVPLDTDNNWKVVTYQQTPIMSTYLLAFVVGEFDYLEDVDSDGVTIRVYTAVGKKEQGRFALQVAVKTLPFYHKYFNIAYPLPKIDLVAIADFSAGAMENWGLVTYRETALLVDPVNSSSSSRQWVAIVVGHELAHQWFGNLVTMEWWTHLWLNEGFASWIEYLCVDHCFPEYDIWTQFASNDYTKALELDALKNSHPIEVEVGHPAEVDEIFDTISYSKGACVIRMLHDYIGDEDYRKGMNIYLTRHKFKNTFTEDLWAALAEASGKPIQQIMSTWTKQMGFPVLKVSQKHEGTRRILTIHQEKFCADGMQSGGDGPLWLVPVSVSSASSPEAAIHRFVLDKREITISIDNVKPDEWVKLNTGAVGFYRTRYSVDMLESLLPAIKNKTLPPRDRLALQNDVFALARAGVTSTVDFLKLAEAFVKEDNYTVWSDLACNLGSLSLVLQYTESHDAYQMFLRNLFSEIAAKLGWDAIPGESHLDCMLRSLILGRMGRSGHQPTIVEARKRFSSHHLGSDPLHPDLRSPVYSTVLHHGTDEDYEKLLTLFRAADLHEEKMRIMRSMGAVKLEPLIKRTLDFSLSEEVRSQDTVFVISSVTGTVLGQEMAWKFIQSRWQELHDRYKGGFLLPRLIKNATENFVTEGKAKEIEAFFSDHPAPAAERTIQQSLENIRLSRDQLQRDSQAIAKFLASIASKV